MSLYYYYLRQIEKLGDGTRLIIKEDNHPMLREGETMYFVFCKIEELDVWNRPQKYIAIERYIQRVNPEDESYLETESLVREYYGNGQYISPCEQIIWKKGWHNPNDWAEWAIKRWVRYIKQRQPRWTHTENGWVFSRPCIQKKSLNSISQPS